MKKERSGKSLDANYRIKSSQIDTNFFDKILNSTQNKEVSSYQDDLEKDKCQREHNREQNTKDFLNSLNIDITTFFKTIAKLIVFMYIVGIILNTFFEMNFDLAKLEMLAYTFVTIGLGVLIDKAIIKPINKV